MIQVIARKKFRFYNPSQKLVANREDGNGNVVQDLAIPAAMTIGKEQMTAELFFDTTPGDKGGFGPPHEAPDWIKAKTKDMVNYITFQNAVADGDLMEVAVVSVKPEDKPAVHLSPDAPERGVAVAPRDGEPVTTPVIDSSAPQILNPEPVITRPLAGGRARRNQNA